MLQRTYPLKKWLDHLELVTRQEVLFPVVIDRETRARMNSKGRNYIGDIESVGAPIPHRINQVIIKELIFTTLVKLDPAATKNMGVVTAGLGFQMEEVAKKRKGRRNSKESFAKMNKNREMEDSIGSKMVQGNLKVTKETMKKSRGKKIEFDTNEGDKKNNLTRT
jgi:hypothetical protein